MKMKTMRNTVMEKIEVEVEVEVVDEGRETKKDARARCTADGQLPA
jgi:hypothetical protein